MKTIGFHERYQHVIMDCIPTPSYSFAINGQIQGRVTPQRGLRQGNPMSPYLFLLCADGFSSLIGKAEREKRLTGFACTLRGPRVSHLLFTDDSMYFCRATLREINTID